MDKIYVTIEQAELTSLAQRLALAESEVDRLMEDNARYLATLRSVANDAADTIGGRGPKMTLCDRIRKGLG